MGTLRATRKPPGARRCLTNVSHAIPPPSHPPAVKQLHALTDLQLQIMGVVWDLGQATVGDVHGALLARTGLARKTIGTLLARLEQQGLLTHREEGREYVYRATVSRDEVGRATTRNLLSRLFQGDLSAFVSHALDANEVAPGDVERVREMIDEWERKQRREPRGRR